MNTIVELIVLCDNPHFMQEISCKAVNNSCIGYVLSIGSFDLNSYDNWVSWYMPTC